MVTENYLIKAIATERLKEVNPEAYEECIRLLDAPLKDLRLMPAVLVELFTRYKPIPENSAFILAVVYYLYEPWGLSYNVVRSVNGLRQILCDAFKWNDKPVVNYYKSIMRAYYKGPRWAAKVQQVADEVHQIITSNEADILAALGDEQNSADAGELGNTSTIDSKK